MVRVSWLFVMVSLSINIVFTRVVLFCKLSVSVLVLVMGRFGGVTRSISSVVVWLFIVVMFVRLVVVARCLMSYGVD